MRVVRVKSRVVAELEGGEGEIEGGEGKIEDGVGEIAAIKDFSKS